MKKILSISLAFLCLLGCTTIMEMSDHGSVTPTESVAIVVALTQLDYRAYSGWDGLCKGCNTDMNRMVKSCREMGIKRVVTLYNEQATTYAVLRQIMLASKALTPAAEAGKRPLMIFYYSGHGGAVYDFFHSEKDSMDQTLCLWDGQLLDNLFWEALIKIPKGVRVLHITDTCNSGTNFKFAPPIPTILGSTILGASVDKIFRARHRYRPIGTEELKCDFIHFGGCADGETSKGGALYGGIFTYTLLEKVNPIGKSYYQWFIEAKAAVSKINQIPTMCVIQSEESIFNNGKVEDGPAMK